MGHSDQTCPLNEPEDPSFAGRAPQPGMPREGDRVLDKYRIEKVQGVGGMGTVFSAHHEILDQRVAVKVLSSHFAENDEFLARFLAEARAAAKLKSEHVARVTDAGKLPSGLPFIVMELLDGCDLEEMLRCHGPFDPTEVADFVMQALEALAQAHAAGIVHRDLKPSNLFLSVKPDGTSIIKILDFGIAKASSAASKRSTGDGRMLGSPSYMSPEQVRCSRGVDARTDIWALGVVMYELLTGRGPFDREGVGATLAAILEDEPLSLTSQNPRVSRAYAEIVERCLSRDRDARYADVGELAAALAPFTSETWRRLVRGIRQTLQRGGGAAVTFGAKEATARSRQETLPLLPAHDTGDGHGDAVELPSELLATIIPPFRQAPRRRLAVAAGAVALGIAGLAWAGRSASPKPPSTPPVVAGVAPVLAPTSPPSVDVAASPVPPPTAQEARPRVATVAPGAAVARSTRLPTAPPVTAPPVSPPVRGATAAPSTPKARPALLDSPE